ncbi:hypothetical protein CIW53_04510 [Rhodanobacter sp. T12-5]|nr:hypothetical protein CIW53_04510 [Rhodanobacter sp. T12-5]
MIKTPKNSANRTCTASLLIVAMLACGSSHRLNTQFVSVSNNGNATMPNNTKRGMSATPNRQSGSLPLRNQRAPERSAAYITTDQPSPIKSINGACRRTPTAISQTISAASVTASKGSRSRYSTATANMNPICRCASDASMLTPKNPAWYGTLTPYSAAQVSASIALRTQRAHSIRHLRPHRKSNDDKVGKIMGELAPAQKPRIPLQPACGA